MAELDDVLEGLDNLSPGELDETIKYYQDKIARLRKMKKLFGANNAGRSGTRPRRDGRPTNRDRIAEYLRVNPCARLGVIAADLDVPAGSVSAVLCSHHEQFQSLGGGKWDLVKAG